MRGNSDKRFDVCIVGAGPAGLSAAETLIRGGASVCLLEKNACPGGKACGGGITGKALELPNDPRLGGHPWHDLVVVASPFRTVLHTQNAYMTTIHRPTWQKVWLDSLKSQKVHVPTSARFLSLTPNGIRTSNGVILCDFVLGADGAVSRVRAQLKLPTAVGIIARQVVLPKMPAGFERPTVHFAPSLFGGGYGWAFPHGNELRLGCGVPSTTHNAAELKRAFTTWISSLKITTKNAIVQSGSIGCRYAGHRFGRVFLAGDAAGFASPVTGEGIGQALQSGALVAEEILCPSARSAEIGALITSHRRTADALTGAHLGPALLRLSALLLRFPWLAHQAMSRFS